MPGNHARNRQALGISGNSKQLHGNLCPLRSPWENGYCESFNSRVRDELRNGELFYSLREAQILIEQWRVHYNSVGPHSALGYRPPAPESIVPMDRRPTMHYQLNWTTRGARASLTSTSPKSLS
ncbi:integrase, catalytic region [Actibacterium atlanticum]|uniref:Integrase, catalytic region n=1 Tax=Actibacterium atlanticum TaxID=1461693 RepID=A0A058ZKL3_9RHOB|nr:integrase, catalytic region [Actibacterium atlanticum]